MNKNKILPLLTAIFVVAGFLAYQILCGSNPVFASDSISELESKIKKEEAAKAKLESELNSIQSSVNTTQSQIQKTEQLINNAEKEIERKKTELQLASSRIDLQKSALQNLVQELYYNQKYPVIYSMLGKDDLSEIFKEADSIINLNQKLFDIIEEIKQSKAEIEENKQEIEEKKDEHEKLLDAKVDQQKELISDKTETQSDIQDKEKVISRLRNELNEMRGDINSVSGKSYSLDEVLKAVKFASRETGVPKGFLIGVLKMETNLAKNTGGCTYATVESGAQAAYKKGKLSKKSWNTFLLRKETFTAICDDLDLDYKKQKVSCNPSSYAGTGGAMGVAQFMPDTWNGYKSGVSSITGNKPPSPWDIYDGTVAMALKLRKTPGVTSGKTSAMKSAACSYLGTCYAPYINGIIYWAENYKELLDL